MSGCRRFHTCACRTRNGVHADVVVEQFCLSKRQESKLYARRKATGVCHMKRTVDLLAVEFGKTVDIVVVFSSPAEILCEVDDANIRRDVMLLEELRALSVTEAEEYDIHFLKGKFGGKAQVCFAIKSGMHVRNQVSRITFAIDKHNFCRRMVEQKANKFASSISGTANDAYSDKFVHFRGCKVLRL